MAYDKHIDAKDTRYDRGSFRLELFSSELALLMKCMRRARVSN